MHKNNYIVSFSNDFKRLLKTFDLFDYLILEFQDLLNCYFEKCI
jgi:hypothetical protein